MELTPEEYAELLIEQHCSIIPIEAAFNDTVESANLKLIADNRASINCAIQDVKNTIKAFNSLDAWTKLHVESELKYYHDVLEILERKL